MTLDTEKSSAKSIFFKSAALSLLLFAYSTPNTLAQVTVNVPTFFNIPSPPKCDFPCADFSVAPDFMRNLLERNHGDTFDSEQTEYGFLSHLDFWRAHAEEVRKSAEALRIQSGPDNEQAKRDYLVRMGYYFTMIDGYLKGYALARSGTINFVEAPTVTE